VDEGAIVVKITAAAVTAGLGHGDVSPAHGVVGSRPAACMAHDGDVSAGRGNPVRRDVAGSRVPAEPIGMVHPCPVVILACPVGVVGRDVLLRSPQVPDLLPNVFPGDHTVILVTRAWRQESMAVDTGVAVEFLL
jgi:hypothetical protein